MSEIYQKLAQQSGLTPIFLYEIYLTDATLYLTNYEQDVTFKGNIYRRFPISIPSLSSNAEGKIDSISITVANVDRMIQGYAELYDGFRGSKVVLYLSFPDLLQYPDYAIKEEFYVSSCTLDAEKAELTLTTKLDLLEIQIPRRTFTKYRCYWRFKSTECGYTGAETYCDKTVECCRKLNNLSRIGCFPAIPADRLIRI